MIVVRVTNCVHQGRRNQNTTFWFTEIRFGLNKEDITEEWILNNLERIKTDIKRQRSTVIKIL